jgi:Ca-activated chloride channel family protein
MVDLLRVVANFALIVPLIPGVLLGRQFASGVNLVEVYATVADREGQSITGLMAADFEISEDGRPQTVATFAAGDFPLSAAVAIDRSFSMSDRVAVAKSAARVFVGALRPSDQVAVLAIGSETETALPLSADHAAALDAIDKLDRWGTTPLFDAMRAAIDLIEPAKGRRALVLVSDGDDRYSETSPGDLLEHARRSHVLIYPIAIGRSRPAVFAELAAATGGRSFHEQTPAGLNATMALIARELRFQYLLGYVPSRTTSGEAAVSEPQWRSIEVRVSRPGAIVRARDGYYSR